MRLYVGTANWGKAYGYKDIKADPGAQKAILDMCEYLDLGVETAYDYKCLDTLEGIADRCETIYKYDTSPQSLRGKLSLGEDLMCMKHHAPYDGYDHVSVYDPYDVRIEENLTWEFPLNIVDQRFVQYLDLTKNYARSVFMQGLAFDMPDFHGIPFYHLCWNFVRSNDYIDGIVVGIDTPEQLEDLLNIPDYEIDYSKIGQEGWYKCI